LTSEIAQIVADLDVLDGELLIQTFFLSEASLEHVDLLAKLIIFKLVFVCFAPNFFVSLFPELSEFTLFGLLDSVNDVVRLLQLGLEVLDEDVLVLLQVFGVPLECVHQAS